MSLYVSMCISPIVTKQWLGLHVLAAKNTRNKEELLDASSPMRSMLYVSLSVYPPIFAKQWLKELLEESFPMLSVLHQRKADD
jgi:hypothetical protein